ncbi:MAG TPA: hypothetical protein VNK92_04130 [Vicinamibacterales bacterium]|nr:hypothetical protein [Vicinamibacterales bacterium]
MAELDDLPILPEQAEPIRDSEAEYTLEYPSICPHCDRRLQTVRVVRLLRTRVNFTSTLPRRGRVIVCPACKRILTAELSGFA